VVKLVRKCQKFPFSSFLQSQNEHDGNVGFFFVFCLFVFLAVSSCVVGILFCLFIYFIVGLEMTKESSLDSHVLPSEVKDPIKARECADHWKCHLLRECMKSGDYMWVLS